MARPTVPPASSGPGKHSKPDVPVTKDPDKTDRYPEVQQIVDQFFPKERRWAARSSPTRS
jgi:hypothetical protein